MKNQKFLECLAAELDSQKCSIDVSGPVAMIFAFVASRYEIDYGDMDLEEIKNLVRIIRKMSSTPTESLRAAIAEETNVAIERLSPEARRELIRVMK